MLSSVAASALQSAFLAPLSLAAQDPTTPSSDGTSGDGANQLSLAQSGLLDGADTYRERTSLQLRAQSQLQVTEDGQTLATAQAKLRFRYDFQAADGSTIQIRLQANLNYAQLTDADTESQTTKLRASLHISILQKNVASGVAPLQNDPSTSTDAQDTISQALDLFQQVTDAARSLFQASDPLDGDSLITSLVDAFNELADSLSSAFLPTPADSTPTDDATTAAELPAPVDTSTPTEPAPVVIDVPVVDVPQPEIAAVEPETVPAEDAAPEESTPQETTSQTEDTTSDTTAEAESSQDATAPATTAPTQSLASTVILRVRLQVIQSLRNLTSVFDGSDTEAPSSSSTQHTSGHHSSWHRAGHFHAHDGWAQRQQLDTWR